MTAISFCWIFSIVTTSLLWINETSGDTYADCSLVYITSMRVMLGLTLLSVSIYTNTVRKRHMKSIMKRRSYFAVSKEKLDMLKRFKKIMKDIIKFNIATIIMPAAQINIEFFQSYSVIKERQVGTIQMVAIILLALSNFIAIVQTQKEIRRQLRETFRTF